MRLNNEVRSYIYNKVNELVACPVEARIIDALREDPALEEFNNAVMKAKAEFLKKFVEDHPEAAGVTLSTRYTCGITKYDLSFSEAPLYEEYKTASAEREKYVQSIREKACIDAARCKDTIELDEMIKHLIEVG